MVVGNTCTKDIEFKGNNTDLFENHARNCSKRSFGMSESAVVSFLIVAGVTIGFRESARLVKIADETGCNIRLASGKRSGYSKSIFSLVQMGIVAGQSFLLIIEGENREAAFHEIRKVLNGETDCKET